MPAPNIYISPTSMNHFLLQARWKFTGTVLVMHQGWPYLRSFYFQKNSVYLFWIHLESTVPLYLVPASIANKHNERSPLC